MLNCISLTRLLLCIGLACCVNMSSSALAGQGPNGGQLSHGLAMHGELKHGPDFTHFDHVNPKAPKGGTIRHAAVGTFDSLHPFIIKGKTAAGAASLYDPLMRRNWNEPFSLYCLLCKSVEVAEDRSWIIFTLRKDAKWSDGKPITVNDLIYSFETHREKGTPGKRIAYSKVTNLERIGTHGLRFEFEDSASREQPLLMGLMPILPQHDWERYDFAKTFLEKRVSSGAYDVSRMEPGKFIEYRLRPDYWGKDLPINRGFNNFEGVRYTYYRDGEAALEGFLAGDTDIRREPSPTRWNTRYNIPAVHNGDIILKSFTHNRPAWNKGFYLNTRRAPLNDIRVRKALNILFNFEWINKHKFFGDQKRINSWFANSDLAANGLPNAAELALLETWKNHLPPEVFGPPVFIATGKGGRLSRKRVRDAKALLAEAGWTLKNGKLINSLGQPLTLEVLLTAKADEDISLIWQRDLKRVGIDLVIKRLDSSVFSERLELFDFDIVIQRIISSLSPGTEQLDRYYGSEAALTDGSRNYTGISNPAVDAVAGAIADAQDRDTLVTATRALDRVLLAHWLIVPWGYINSDRIAHRSSLSHPPSALYGSVIETWWQK